MSMQAMSVRPLYGVPIGNNNPNPFPGAQPLYGVISPPNPNPSPFPGIQPLYGIISPPNPTPSPTPQPLYGVISPPNPCPNSNFLQMFINMIMQIFQMMFGFQSFGR